MKVLLVTPSLGTSPWLDATVASVEEHAPEARHRLVVPSRLVSVLQARFPRTEIVAEAGGGMYGAINEAVRLAGEWDLMGYLNDDDLLLEGFRELFRRADSGWKHVLYGDVEYIASDGRRLGRMPVASPQEVGAILARGRAAVAQQGALITRATWEALSGFDCRWRLASDYDFWCRASAQATEFRRVSATVAAFRLHGHQLSSNRDAMDAEIASIRKIHRAEMMRRSRTGARLTFRVRSLARVIERRHLAGVWTSRALYARYSSVP